MVLSECQDEKNKVRLGGFERLIFFLLLRSIENNDEYSNRSHHFVFFKTYARSAHIYHLAHSIADSGDSKSRLICIFMYFRGKKRKRKICIQHTSSMSFFLYFV